jgi:hypothetical protein
MRTDSERYLLELRASLGEVERRGRTWLERNIRVGNINLLRNRDAVENRFRNEVVADAPREIEDVVHRMVDWTVRRNLKLWTAVFAELDAHTARLRASGALAAHADTEFQYNREELFARLRQPVERRLGDFNAEAEAREVVESMREAVTQAFGVNVLALGLGAVLVAVFTTAALDVTGVLTATLFAIAGWLIIPARRRQLIRDLEEKIAKLSADLSALLAAKFQEQLTRYEQQLLEVIQPYERFLETERAKLERSRTDGRSSQRAARSEVDALEQRSRASARPSADLGCGERDPRHLRRMRGGEAGRAGTRIVGAPGVGPGAGGVGRHRALGADDQRMPERARLDRQLLAGERGRGRRGDGRGRAREACLPEGRLARELDVREGGAERIEARQGRGGAARLTAAHLAQQGVESGVHLAHGTGEHHDPGGRMPGATRLGEDRGRGQGVAVGLAAVAPGEQGEQRLDPARARLVVRGIAPAGHQQGERRRDVERGVEQRRVVAGTGSREADGRRLGGGGVRHRSHGSAVGVCQGRRPEQGGPRGPVVPSPGLAASERLCTDSGSRVGVEVAAGCLRSAAA